MAPQRPSFTIRLDADDQCRVVISGEIDVNAVPELFSRLQDADRLQCSPVIVDMRDATLLDSAGLGVLARLAAAGVQIQITGATGIVRRALDISGVAVAPNIRVRDDA